MKCAMERPECRKMCTVCQNKSRNRRENLPGFRETMGSWCCHIGFPKSCYDDKHANVSDRVPAEISYFLTLIIREVSFFTRRGGLGNFSRFVNF